MSDILAYHEAGHVLMAWMLGGQVQQVTIKPDRDDGPRREGDTQVAWDRARMSDQDLARISVQVCLAGPVAELIYTGEPCPSALSAWAADWQEACEATMLLFHQPQQQLAYLQQVSRKLYLQFQRDETWAAIAALADHLLAHETLDQDEVEAIAGYWCW